MNRIDQLEKMLANRRWDVEGVDERMAFDALPELLAVVRAVQNTDTRCLFRYRPASDPFCGSCVMCVLRAALDPLIVPQLAVERKPDGCGCRGPGPCCGVDNDGVCGCAR